ncbi:glycerophosphodiester phosphodiesterase [Rufibacter psychrotolerans]|uniref:glycerophosphodiester phosphodiesterase n=1 Tax=Rufibacter psychrotolerans TaxID=2812556 RepID=UPI0019671DB7|nr:glycerophosphodiester phosphodiesterase family protein [Rufibacter sp. SYSU D00308]
MLLACRTFWVAFGASILMALSGSAQSGITLTNFTFTPQRLVVGKVVRVVQEESTPTVKLSKESKKLFTLGQDNSLAIKKKAANQKDAFWHDVVLEWGEGQRDTFRIVRDEFLKNPVVAHRGAWKNTKAPENSLAALQQAIRLGCAASEFDVHLSADSVVFVNHNPTFKGIHLEKSPASSIAQLTLKNGEAMPTLQTYLAAGLGQNKTRLILEMKPSVISKERGRALAQKVVELVRQHKAQAWVDYISFDYDILQKVLELDPYARVAFLGGHKPPAELAKDRLYGSDYHFSFLKKFPEWIGESHRLGLTVNTWTIDKPEDMDWLLERNVDFITTNQPELLLQKLAAKKQ